MRDRPGTRAQRRAAGANGDKIRRACQWPAWKHHTFPAGTISSTGWTATIQEAFSNGLYSVLVRAAPDGVIHMAIGTIRGIEPPWRDLQRLKDELFGPERIALSVCPPRSRLIDEADMYHLWVLPVGAAVGFGLHPRDEVDD